MHAHNPLAPRGRAGRRRSPRLRYLIAAPAVTGEVLTIDGGQRFWRSTRDVQFLERQHDRERRRPKLDGLVPDHLQVRVERAILLDSLEVMADIGFHEFEIGAPQRLLVTVEIWLDDMSAAGQRRSGARLGL